MAEIKVTVSSTKPQKVSVSNNTIQHEVTASPDLAQYYSNISKNYSEVAENWATKTDGKVDGIEYSAKHYAQKAETLGIEALQNLEIAETQAIADVNVARDNAIIELNTTGQEQINTVSEKVSEAIEGVENAGRIVEEAIEDIQNTAEKNKKELQTISNEIKENAQDIANRTSLSMFDTILKDHLLTYEESKGLALQGTYVYKEAIAGSRYGYPDFYNKCLEEFNEATSTETINGVTVKVHSNGHKFYDIANKSAIDSSFNSLGTAWMYGVDTENERVFLPRNNWFEQMTANSSEVGDSIEAGLPNITGTTTSLGAGGEANGAFSVVKSWGNGLRTGDGGSHETCYRKDFNASRSSDVYGKSNTVQPNAVKKLLYICVGNTESQSTVTDVVDVTTTENDTLPLGYHFYQAGAQPSVSYLKSAGQWNDGNVYATFYNEFVQKVGQAFAGGKVVNYTDDYTDYDLVLNQDDMTFRLPLLDGSEDLEGSNTLAINLVSGGVAWTAPCNGQVYVEATTSNAGGWIQISKNEIKYIHRSYYTTVPETLVVNMKKGDDVILTNAGSTIKATSFIPFVGNGNLYFKVANAVQNLELLNAGEVLEAVADIIPNNSSLISSYGMPSSKYIDLTLGASGTTYTAPANGWVYIRGKAGAANQYLAIIKYLDNGKSYEASVMWAHSTTTDLYVHTPVLKGEKFRVSYTMAGTAPEQFFRFHYAEGEV